MPSEEEEWGFASAEEAPASAFTLTDPDPARDADAERVDGPRVNRYFKDKTHVLGSLPDDEEHADERVTYDRAKQTGAWIKCERPAENKP